MQQDTKQLEIGHKIKVTNYMNNYVLTIVRVTKTRAMSAPYNNAGSYASFKREYLNPKWLTLIPRIKWSTTNYELINEKEINKHN